MPTVPTLLQTLDRASATQVLSPLYSDLAIATGRIRSLLSQFEQFFPKADDIHLFSTPGRTEVGGNHTDHNGGRVLAAAVDRDVLAAAAQTSAGMITVYSEGYPKVEIQVNDLDAGIYHLVVTTASGKATRLFVKQ